MMNLEEIISQENLFIINSIIEKNKRSSKKKFFASKLDKAFNQQQMINELEKIVGSPLCYVAHQFPGLDMANDNKLSSIVGVIEIDESNNVILKSDLKVDSKKFTLFLLSKAGTGYYQNYCSMKENGYFILRNVYSDSILEAFKKSMYDNNEDFFKQTEIKRKLLKVNIEKELNTPEFYFNHKVTPYLKALLCENFVLESSLSPSTLPGSERQTIHTDGGTLFGREHNLLLPPYAIGIIIPVEDMNEATGTTRLWPKTHKLRDVSHIDWSSGEYVDLNLSKGDCLFMDTRLCHAGTSNNSLNPRVMFYLTYSHPWYVNYTDFTEVPSFEMNDKEFEKVPTQLRNRLVRRNIQVSFAKK